MGPDTRFYGRPVWNENKQTGSKEFVALRWERVSIIRKNPCRHYTGVAVCAGTVTKRALSEGLLVGCSVPILLE